LPVKQAEVQKSRVLGEELLASILFWQTFLAVVEMM
jgi:hypothetical protein